MTLMPTWMRSFTSLAPRLTAPAAVVVVFGLGSGLGGCVAENNRLTVGHEIELEAFTSDERRLEPLTVTQLRPDVAYPAFPEGRRSLTSLDRSNWTEKTILVPVDGVGHRPHYAESVQLKNSTARQRGEFPTALSALEVTGGFTDEQLVETFTQPLVIFGSAVILPARLLIDPQWNVRYSPNRSYDRWPEPGSDPAIMAEVESPVEVNAETAVPDPDSVPTSEEWPR
jgi:hypothetical protein